MAAPHGVKPKDLKCRFMENTDSDASPDAQGESGKSDFHVFDMDVEKTSDEGLEPSILSIFQEKASAAELCSRMDAENEASLLSALTEILDSVDVETLSPFDMLPDSDIFSPQKSPDHMRLYPNPKFSQSSSSKTGKDLVVSDRQLRPRRQTDNVKNLTDSKSHSRRTFQIESELMFPQDELKFLLDLVRHMHPYCLRTHLEKDTKTTDVHVSVEDEEEVFVDVEGFEETEENILEVSGKESNLHSALEENRTFVNKDVNKMPQRSALVKKNNTGRTKKRVSFALHLTLVYEISPEEPDPDLPGTSALEDTVDECFSHGCDDSKTSSSISEQTCDITSSQKRKSLSLQQYRLLRQNKQLPLDERRTDHQTKWPSLPDIPSELPPILPELNTTHVNPITPLDEKLLERPSSTSDEVRRSSCRNAANVKSAGKKVVNTYVDPPNPTIVTLNPLQHKPQFSTIMSEVPIQQIDVKPQTQPVTVQTSELMKSDSHKSDFCSSCDDALFNKLKPVTITSGSKLKMSSTCSRQDEKTPTNEQHSRVMAGEIGIEATDLTSLLEQFETQACEEQMISTVKCQDLMSTNNRLTDLGSTAGLTPPATPPHHTCKPLLPVRGAKHEFIKPSPSKTIQIIEPRPLPPIKSHLKSLLPFWTSTLNPAQAFIDHDYCSSSHTNTHSPSRAGSEHRTESLSGSVLLSPDSSPCRTDAYESLRFSSRSPSPQDRGRTRKRVYRYRCSNSGSRSSCSSSSSSRSRSPARKRYHHRHSGSSSSSRSSSRSPSRSPPRKRGRHRTRSRSRSLCRSRSGSGSSERNLNENLWQRSREMNLRHEEARKIRQQKAIEERRVVYVGGIRASMTPSDLKERFLLFGKVEDCTVHIRSHGDNYGFVTYSNTDDAFAAIESGSRLRRADERPFDICFGGRRQFCKSNYADLDSSRDILTSSDSLDFDTLLRQAQRGTRR